VAGGLTRAAVLLTLAAGMAGCGATSYGPTGAPGGGPGAPVACRTPLPSASGSARVVHLTGADSGATVCVRRGDLVEVDLAAPASTRWSFRAQGSSLRVASDGAGTPTAASSPVFEAVAPGTASIRGARRACATPSSSGVACGAIEAYRVTVVVH
jgi:hypothetical protein